MINKEALEILAKAKTVMKEAELDEVCEGIMKEALFGFGKETVNQLKKKLLEKEKENAALKFGNKAWKAAGKAGVVTGVGGVGYGLYQKKKSEQDPAFNMYNPI